MVPPPAVVNPLPGSAPAAAPADPRRDPFAPSAQAAPAPAAAAPRAQALVDAGPQVELPAERKNLMPLFIGGAIVLLFGTGVGYLVRGITHARGVFNQTIADAKRIEGEVKKLAEVEAKVVTAIKSSTTRNKGSVTYDEQLIKDLKSVVDGGKAEPLDVQKTQRAALFRTNYARMDDGLIDKLFNYYNDSLRLFTTMRDFVRHAERRKDEVQSFLKQHDAAAGRYAVLASDKGRFYEGRLVEVGLPMCGETPATDASCTSSKVTGFQIRAIGSSNWTTHDARPGDNSRYSGLVVPIRPDRSWNAIATAKPGLHAYERYLFHYRGMVRIAALLKQTRKPLLEALRKQSGRTKLAGL